MSSLRRWFEILFGWWLARRVAPLLLLLGTAGRAEPAATEATHFQVFYYSWPRPREFHNASTATPAVAPDGTVYVGSFNGNCFALTPAGNPKWSFRAGREIHSSPAIGTDGTLYFGARDGKFYALTPAGRLRWIFPTGGWVDASPAIGADGTLYFGSWDKYFYALNPDGRLKWKFATGAVVNSSPAIAQDGTVYFGSHDQKLYALTTDGRERWTFLTGGEISASPAIGEDGTVYFSSRDGHLYALNPDGTKRWQAQLGGIGDASPVLTEAGHIVVAGDHQTKTFSKDGQSGWSWPADGDAAVPAAVAAGQVYVAPPGRELHALTEDGQLRWTVHLEDQLSSAPVIAGDGTIYASVGAGLYVIHPPNPPPPATSTWPMFRGNPRHTGRAHDP